MRNYRLRLAQIRLSIHQTKKGANGLGVLANLCRWFLSSHFSFSSRNPLHQFT